MTRHSEGAIGRYQQQFAVVLYLLHIYPEASEDELCCLSDLSRAARDVYAELGQELAEQPACVPHLERLRRRYELDPEGLAFKVPAGKAH